MKVKLESIIRNNTWELTTLPKGHNAIGLKWVFKTKRDANGNIVKHKARLVAKGYIQEHGIDFEEIFALVARMETIRLLLAIAANNKWEVHHLDVKSAFLHGDLKEEVYITQPEDNTLKSLDFKKCALEQAIYTKRSKDSTQLIGIYVDDLIITSTPKKEIDKFKAQMEEKLKMSDLGILAYYLGIEVTQTNGDISIKQSAYASKILKEAGMIDCNETLIQMDPCIRLTKITEETMVNSTEYQSLIGCLRYLLHTRPDLKANTLTRSTTSSENALKEKTYKSISIDPTAAPSLPIPKNKPSVPVKPPVKPPHPDTKYLSQILSVLKPDQLCGDDDLEWLFNRKEGKKPPAEDPQV
nr:ribonuclease H-like domain, reverse transcriptase, RNA-dependent DNA polymerase [Tanacetum cinerariifolium]